MASGNGANEMIEEIRKKAIGKRIRHIRQEKDLMQKEVATALGVSHSTLSRIENGELLPTTTQLMKLQEKYGVSVDWILFGKGPILPLTAPAQLTDELTMLFEEMTGDRSLRHFILSCFYQYLEVIRKEYREPVTKNDG